MSVLLIVLMVVACGEGDVARERKPSPATTLAGEPSPTPEPATTTSGSTSLTATTGSVGFTVADVVTEAQRRLDDLSASDLENPSVAIVIDCPDLDRRVLRGSVLSCDNRSPAPAAAETGRLALVVLDDSGSSAMLSASDLPDLEDAYANVPHGLLCRDLLANRAGFPFDVSGTAPDTAAFLATAYWMLEGMPARMDADGDGTPCETVFPDAAIEWVWDGAQLTGTSWSAELELRGDGLGVVDFGVPVRETLQALISFLGEPALLIEDPDAIAEQNWYYGHASATARLAVWAEAGVTVAFSDYPFYRDDGTTHFSGWTYAATPTASYLLATPEGVTVGDTLAEAQEAYGDRLAVNDDVCGPDAVVKPEIAGGVRFTIALEFNWLPHSPDQSTLSVLHAGASPGC